MGVICVIVILMVPTWYFVIREDEDDVIDTKDIINFENTNVTLSISVSEYPRVDSSTSAHPLNVIIACKVLNCSYNWETYFWDNTRWLVPFTSDANRSHIVDHINKNIQPSGTHGSYVNLIENKTDLILVAREPSDDELELAKNNSVDMQVRPVALDAFVFILNEK